MGNRYRVRRNYLTTPMGPETCTGHMGTCPATDGEHMGLRVWVAQTAVPLLCGLAQSTHRYGCHHADSRRRLGTLQGVDSPSRRAVISPPAAAGRRRPKIHRREFIFHGFTETLVRYQFSCCGCRAVMSSEPSQAQSTNMLLWLRSRGR